MGRLPLIKMFLKATKKPTIRVFGSARHGARSQFQRQSIFFFKNICAVSKKRRKHEKATTHQDLDQQMAEMTRSNCDPPPAGCDLQKWNFGASPQKKHGNPHCQPVQCFSYSSTERERA